jgi:hypothetical protein
MFPLWKLVAKGERRSDDSREREIVELVHIYATYATSVFNATQLLCRFKTLFTLLCLRLYLFEFLMVNGGSISLTAFIFHTTMCLDNQDYRKVSAKNSDILCV